MFDTLAIIIEPIVLEWLLCVNKKVFPLFLDTVSRKRDIKPISTPLITKFWTVYYSFPVATRCQLFLNNNYGQHNRGFTGFNGFFGLICGIGWILGILDGVSDKNPQPPYQGAIQVVSFIHLILPPLAYPESSRRVKGGWGDSPTYRR